MEFCMLRTKKTRLSGEHTRDETMSYFHFATTSRCYFVNYRDIDTILIFHHGISRHSEGLSPRGPHFKGVAGRYSQGSP